MNALEQLVLDVKYSLTEAETLTQLCISLQNSLLNASLSLPMWCSKHIFNSQALLQKEVETVFDNARMSVLKSRDLISKLKKKDYKAIPCLERLIVLFEEHYCGLKQILRLFVHSSVYEFKVPKLCVDFEIVLLIENIRLRLFNERS